MKVGYLHTCNSLFFCSFIIPVVEMHKELMLNPTSNRWMLSSNVNNLNVLMHFILWVTSNSLNCPTTCQHFTLDLVVDLISPLLSWRLSQSMHRFINFVAFVSFHMATGKYFKDRYTMQKLAKKIGSSSGRKFLPKVLFTRQTTTSQLTIVRQIYEIIAGFYVQIVLCG